MDSKISSDYWGHPQVEIAPPPLKLAGLWMRTNDRVMLCGYAEVTARRFAFETGLPEEDLARAIQALGDLFTQTAKGYFMPDHIREQIGSGDALLNNNVCKGLVRGLVALNDSEITALVLEEYPELHEALKVSVFPKPLASPPQGVREEKRGAEQSRTEQSSPPGPGKNSRRATRPGLTPADQPEPVRGRMLQLNDLFRRKPDTRWSADEIEQLKAAGLEAMTDFDFTEQHTVMLQFYRADIPREMDKKFWRRTELVRVLRHWPGELDRARAWALHLRKAGGDMPRLSQAVN